MYIFFLPKKMNRQQEKHILRYHTLAILIFESRYSYIEMYTYKYTHAFIPGRVGRAVIQR